MKIYTAQEEIDIALIDACNVGDLRQLITYLLSILILLHQLILRWGILYPIHVQEDLMKHCNSTPNKNMSISKVKL